MAKPVARLGVSIDGDTWNTLLKVGEFEGVKSFDFVIETGHPCVWLYYVADDQAAISRLVDLRDNLPCKSGGELRDWSEASTAYFRAAVRVARAEALLHASAEGSERHRQALEERALASRERDEALKTFQAAVSRGAQDDVDHEEFERQNSERLRFLR